jgi:fimbrial isopeptide formation D2 family protein/LPXTG-motif cell wall-anchored protein
MMGTQQRGRLTRRVAAVIGALALGMMGTVAATGPASAALPGNIDGSQNGHSSITVHKHAQPSPVGAAGDGTDQGVLANPLQGVDFALYQLSGVDLTTTAGWDTADTISAAINGGAVPVPNADPATSVTIDGTSYPVTAVGTQATDGNGEATWGSLPFGIYLVVEGADHGNNHITDTSAPFIVSLPFATGKNTWLYDVHAYPKNSVTSVTKSVTPQPSGSLGLGSVVSFPVTAAVPNLTTGKDFTSFVVKDSLDSRLGSVGAASVTLDTATGAAVDPSHYSTDVTGQTVTVTFTPAGLTWLKTLPAGSSIVVTFQGTVTSLGDGAIQNQATAFINDPSKTNGFDSNTVTTNWGDVRILKYADTPAKTGLAGATFEIYAATDPYATDCSAATPTGAAIPVNGATQFTSDTDGLATIAGLFVSDSVNAPISATQRCYVVKEVQAPVGYVTPTGADALHGIAVTTGATNTGSYDLEVANTQVPKWALPLTGGAGTLPFTIGGAAILIVALGSGLVLSRRQRSRA